MSAFRWKQPPSSKKKKVDGDGGVKKEVEVLYADGVWYRGWLSSYIFESGKWIVKFYDDDETTEVDFPDKDVRLVNKINNPSCLFATNISIPLYSLI